MLLTNRKKTLSYQNFWFFTVSCDFSDNLICDNTIKSLQKGKLGFVFGTVLYNADTLVRKHACKEEEADDHFLNAMVHNACRHHLNK